MFVLCFIRSEAETSNSQITIVNCCHTSHFMDRMKLGTVRYQRINESQSAIECNCRQTVSLRLIRQMCVIFMTVTSAKIHFASVDKIQMFNTSRYLFIWSTENMNDEGLSQVSESQIALSTTKKRHTQKGSYNANNKVFSFEEPSAFGAFMQRCIFLPADGWFILFSDYLW